MYNTFPYLLSYFTMSDKVMEITVLWDVTLCSLPVYYSLTVDFAAVIFRAFE